MIGPKSTSQYIEFVLRCIKSNGQRGNTYLLGLVISFMIFCMSYFFFFAFHAHSNSNSLLNRTVTLGSWSCMYQKEKRKICNNLLILTSILLTMLLLDCTGLNSIILIALWDTYHIQGPWTIAWEGSGNVHLQQPKSTCLCCFLFENPSPCFPSAICFHVHFELRCHSFNKMERKKKGLSQHMQISIISKAPSFTLFKY